MSGVERARAREGVALLLSGWLLRCVVEYVEGGVIQAYVG